MVKREASMSVYRVVCKHMQHSAPSLSALVAFPIFYLNIKKHLKQINFEYNTHLILILMLLKKYVKNVPEPNVS